MRITIGFFLLALASYTWANNAPNGTDIIKSAMKVWRGASSDGEMTMTIHRPDWERSMTIHSRTKGLDKSFLIVKAPKKDAGNATLLLNDNMWSYSPRIKRVIKIPSSMMAQSWMGSDLSNRDITKDTDVIDEYDHTLIGTREENGHIIYQIRSIPHENAPVVWGKEIYRIRDDFLILQQEFWDQDNQLVKTIRTLEHQVINGRPVGTRMRIQDENKPDEWTELAVDNIQFDIDIDDSVFTVGQLRSAR
ncbi:MAG: outer membrane lipoprotein-sorting protein [Halieaceae bacterium]|nr:outer membrane lipoprotein-sorting protein [Halieaceae bacterium]